MLRRTTFLIVLTLGLSSFGYSLRTDSKGQVVHWVGHVEFVIDARLAVQIGEPRADTAISTAVQTVAEATPNVTVGVHVGTSAALGYQTGASNQNDITVLEDWPYDERALAATVVTLDTATHQILDADIVVNASEHHFRVVDAMAAGERDASANDVQNTLTHELGHALGLLHNAADDTVVMFPSAPPLEISKRTLAADDKAGLTALYAGVVTPSSGVQLAGCSTTSQGPAGALWLLVAALLLGRRRAGAIAALVVPALAFAEPPAAVDLTQAQRVAVAEVSATTSARSLEHPGLLFTELTLTVRQCLKGECPASVTVRVPGGRLGTLEQVVAHEPVPALKELVVAHHRDGARPAILRLADPEHRQRAEAALSRAGLSLPGSAAPQAVARTPSDGPNTAK